MTDGIKGVVSRRTSIALGVASIGLAAMSTTIAQEASPVDEFGATPVDSGSQYLFLQTFSSSQLIPVDDEPGTFTLKLEGNSGETIYFADRPSHVVGLIATQFFVPMFRAETAKDPANAAIVGSIGDSDRVIHVVEIIDLQYDVATATATYTVRVLDNWDVRVLPIVGIPQQVNGITDYESTQLFIDGGGLMQLIAYGAQDVYLPEN